MFAQKYFKMARQTPFKLAKREVPKNIVICDQITNWVFLILNSIPPVLYGVGSISYFEAYENRNIKSYHLFFSLARISYLVTEFIPIMSGVYLFTALYFLRKFVRDDYEVNFKAMSLHATSFGLYMASVLLYIFVNYMWL